VLLITLKKINAISLKVIDGADSLPIDKSTVKICGDDKILTVLSNEKGEVELPSLNQEQEYSIEITAIGYSAVTRKITFRSGDVQHIIPMERNFKKMDEVVIASGDYRTFRCRCCGIRVLKASSFETKKNADDKFGFSVFPNPVFQNQTLTVVPKKKVSGYYQVLSVSGQVLRSGKVDIGPNQPFAINLANYTAGSYFIRLLGQTPGELQTEKFIIQ
jgi:hypothetical protein